MVKKVGKYEIGKTLGEGTFGKVKFAINLESGDRVAMKILDKQKILKQNMVEQIKKEISIMKMIRNKHVINLIDVLVSKTKIYLVLELVTGGELFYKLANEGRFDEDRARYYWQQLMAGVEYCHSQKVVHRDLKPENLLLDENDTLKISDFGLSSLFLKASNGGEEQSTYVEANQNPELLHTTCGTPNYVAPEVLADKGYEGPAADIWSCGVILYVLLAGFLPFEDPSTEELFRQIRAADFKYPPWFSPPVRNLLNKILVADPNKRASLAEIKADPWFRINMPASAAASVGADVTADKIEPDDQVFNEVEEAQEEPGKESKIPGMPATMNAFELINMSGAFDLTRLLQKDPVDHVKRYTRFSSTHQPAAIIKRVTEVLSEMPVAYQPNPQHFKVRVQARHTSRGPITFTIQVMQISPGLFMVDFSKRRGDILEYHRLYRKVYEKLADIVHNDM